MLSAHLSILTLLLADPSDPLSFEYEREEYIHKSSIINPMGNEIDIYIELYYQSGASIYYIEHGPYYGIKDENYDWLATTPHDAIEVVFGISGDPDWLSEACDSGEYIASGIPYNDTCHRLYP